nr:reverse transcriptase domain-containing protein [Tanacetum cinerariifolium]
VYVDDLVVKSHTEAEMVRDIEETFRTLRRVNMKLNPKKCSFGLAEGVFLGYVITPEGIKPCMDKTAAPSDMTGVPRSVAEHRLNIREGYTPVRQKKRSQAPERARAIQAEVQKMVDAGIMREVYYHDWLSNPVMVKKHDGSWRMCVDFTDLNRACPQDCYPLSEIDWK